jgi:late competence protein required for DNA uptake (superfamily II DNA/RNA helicase)
MCKTQMPNPFCVWMSCHECKRKIHQEEWPMFMHNGCFFCRECAGTLAGKFRAERADARARERKRILQQSWRDFWRVVWAYVVDWDD